MSELGRLRWRCRRGTRELDQLLQRYLDSQYASASATEKRAFETLLELPDPELLALLLGRTRADTDELARLVDQIRSGSG